ncbi:TetR/AcrR family transcriptional regulator [Agrobacterium tumefaciens]|uniref:TetR/AcrR family transcriptional regulator n=1 Tax=Agrobacterium tumefaciens TaxID=358 RepID=UPI00045AC785|nr:TetR/AcrR family transcriptional regulator [Agrobacterium tumefaciens]TQN62517.1 TetR/AcrR family transcriptional regulator [Agrobacterium tumefaciens]CDN94568.1 Transcriptional regulator [Agrobacterium tumefaciens]
MTPTDKINHARVASHHGGRPTPAESERISARIMAAARKLFLRDGFAQTSMDAIAAEIGISKRTLYSRHPGKAALFEAIVLDVVNTGLSNIVTEQLSGKTPRDKLLALSLRILEVATDPLIISLERVVVGESWQFPKWASLVGQYGMPPIREEVMAVLRDHGASEPGLARDAEIFLSITMIPQLRQAVLQRTPPGIAGIDRAALERTIDIFVRGIEMEL